MRYVILAVFLFLSLVSPANAQEPEKHKIFLPMVTGMATDCKESWRLIKPDRTTNKALNPSAETTGNFAALAGTTVTRVTTDSFVGLQSYRVQSNNNNEGMTLTLETLANTTHFVTLRVTGDLPPAWDWSLDNVNYRAPALIESIDGDWDLYGLSFPASQANGSTTLYIRQNGAGAGDFFIDGVQVEAKTYWTTYCDGTQEGCSWAGTAHASVSERSPQSRAGGRVLNLQSDFGFFVEEVVGVGAAPETINTRSYAILPGGELSGSKTESRNFTLIGRFIADSEEDLHAKRQELIEELGINTYPESQAIRIRFSGAQVQKQISAHYTGGLEAQLKVSYGPWQVEGEDSWRKLTHWTERLTIQFLAPDPMWFEIGESSVLLDTNDSVTLRYTTGRLKTTGQWDDLGLTANPTTNGDVFAIAVGSDGLVYFGGSFTGWDGVAGRDYLVAYNPRTDTWSTVGGASDINNTVYALKFGPNGDLYVGGDFVNVDGIANADHLVRYTPSTNTFAAVGQPVQGTANISSVHSIEFGPDGILYAGGFFTDWANIANADGLVSWDGTTYAALGAPGVAIIDGTEAIVSTKTKLYVGGNWDNWAGIADADKVAAWDYENTAWEALGVSSARGNVSSLVLGVDDVLYVGGQFNTWDGLPEGANLVLWNETAFFSVGGGLNGQVLGLSFSPDNILYATGVFTEAGGVSLADRAARWNGASWAHLDLDLPGAPLTYVTTIGPPDPVVNSNYDIWFGFNSTGATEVAGLTIATNDGAQPTFPRFILSRTGGTSAVLETLRNETTGKELLFDYGLLDGETLTINLEPRNKSIISSMFGSRLDAVFANSDFGIWSLQPNDNDISSFVNVAGGPTVTSWLLWKDTYRSLD